MAYRMVSYKVWYAIAYFFYAMLVLTLALELLGVFHEAGLVLAVVELAFAVGSAVGGATKEGVARVLDGQADLMATQHVLVRGQQRLVSGIEGLREDSDGSLHLQEAMLDRHERSNMLLQDIRDLLERDRGASA